MRWRRLSPDAPAIIGYAARRSHHLVDVAACPQLEPALEAALGEIRAVLGKTLGGAGEIELLLGREGAIHIVLEGHDAPACADAAAALVGKAGILGVVLRSAAATVTLGVDLIDLGDGGDTAPFLAAADLFAQVSAPGNDALRRLVLAAAGPLSGLRVLELYAGSGNFTRDLAGEAAHVVAVEDAPAPPRSPRATSPPPASPNASSGVPGPAEDALAADEHFDVVVVDPPRAGLRASASPRGSRPSGRARAWSTCRATLRLLPVISRSSPPPATASPA